MEFFSNPIIYHLVVDRFNCHDFDSKLKNFTLGGFLGGTFEGITSKVEDGYFEALGVNALLISAPFQQIFGWVPGAGKNFKHYGYHGYYTHDFTVIEPRLGTEADLLRLSETCHARGIALLIDVVLNHPGYEEPHSLAAAGIDVLAHGWEFASTDKQHSFIDYNNGDFSGWWGKDWVRANLPGYSIGGDDEQTKLLYGLPDFKTESQEFVRLPKFLKDKQDTRATEIPDSTVRGYLVEWITEWISRVHIDGFRCDSAKHVEFDTWTELKATAEEKYQKMNCEKKQRKFWMLGEVWGHGIQHSEYYDFGFDSLLNFDFQDAIASGKPTSTIFDEYAQAIFGRSESLPISYLSSQDTFLFERSKLKLGAMTLLLAPGGVEIFYGDETARQPDQCVHGDVSQANRSPMNWSTMDKELLGFWQMLGTFRRKHISISQGEHITLSSEPYVFFRRVKGCGDLVLVAMGVMDTVMVDVSQFFSIDVILCDYVSKRRSRVTNGILEIIPAELHLFELN